MSLEYYSMLTQFGNFYPLNLKIKSPNQLVDWTEENFEYVPYNPRKKIDRWGLSITSLNGGVDGIPDLDSLSEYNKENDTAYKEEDFCVHTPVYEHPELKKILSPFDNYYVRTHFLKLNPGGFFPPHRDLKNDKFQYFRLIVPLKNYNPPYFNFILEDKMLYWEGGKVYFFDSAKTHYLFNCSSQPSYWIVINVNTNEQTVKTVMKHFEAI